MVGYEENKVSVCLLYELNMIFLILFIIQLIV